MPRRRMNREPAFGSDSFLDVIANLVGIVLIIIVLVGAHVRELPNLTPPAEPVPDLTPPSDSESPQLTDEMVRLRAELARLQQRLLDALRELEQTTSRTQMLKARRDELMRSKQNEATRLAQADRGLDATNAELARLVEDQRSLEDRLTELRKAIQELESLPPERRTLRFHLPVSRPISSGELLFECRRGRVTFIDLQAFLDQVKQSFSQKTETLRAQWDVHDTTRTVGAFQMKYTIARERATGLDRAFGSLPPTEKMGFSYGLDSWELEPVLAVRGETLGDALATGSDFRRIAEGVDADQVVLTFFVYPDSFELFRRLRDYLYDRGFVVVGRPLPEDRPIAGSRRGSISQGQ